MQVDAVDRAQFTEALTQALDPDHGFRIRSAFRTELRPAEPGAPSLEGGPCPATPWHRVARTGPALLRPAARKPPPPSCEIRSTPVLFGRVPCLLSCAVPVQSPPALRGGM